MAGRSPSSGRRVARDLGNIWRGGSSGVSRRNAAEEVEEGALLPGSDTGDDECESGDEHLEAAKAAARRLQHSTAKSARDKRRALKIAGKENQRLIQRSGENSCVNTVEEKGESKKQQQRPDDSNLRPRPASSSSSHPSSVAACVQATDVSGRRWVRLDDFYQAMDIAQLALRAKNIAVDAIQHERTAGERRLRDENERLRSELYRLEASGAVRGAREGVTDRGTIDAEPEQDHHQDHEEEQGLELEATPSTVSVEPADFNSPEREPRGTAVGAGAGAGAGTTIRAEAETGDAEEVNERQLIAGEREARRRLERRLRTERVEMTAERESWRIEREQLLAERREILSAQRATATATATATASDCETSHNGTVGERGRGGEGIQGGGGGGGGEGEGGRCFVDGGWATSSFGGGGGGEFGCDAEAVAVDALQCLLQSLRGGNGGREVGKNGGMISSGMDLIETKEAEAEAEGEWERRRHQRASDLARAGGVTAVLGAMAAHVGSERVQSLGAEALFCMAESSDQARAILLAEPHELLAGGTVPALVGAMIDHPDNPSMQKQAGGALMTLAAHGGDDARKAIAVEGGSRAIVAAMKRHPSISYEGKFTSLHLWLFSTLKAPMSLPGGLDGGCEYDDFYHHQQTTLLDHRKIDDDDDAGREEERGDDDDANFVVCGGGGGGGGEEVFAPGTPR